jgi:hypothetical protein
MTELNSIRSSGTPWSAVIDHHVRVPVKLTSPTAEAFVRHIIRPPKRPSILLPHTARAADPFAYSSFIQAVITWGQRPGVGRVVLPPNKEIEDVYARLRKDDIALTACIFADEIYNSSGEDVTQHVHALLTDAVRSRADLPQKQTGSSVGFQRTILAVDHVPAHASPSGFYARVWDSMAKKTVPVIDHRATSLYYLEDLSLQALIEPQDVRLPLGNRILQMSSLAVGSLGDYRMEAASLGAILFELIQNTHIHARPPMHLRNKERSLRLLQVKTITKTRGHLRGQCVSDQSFARYLERVPAMRQSRTRDGEVPGGSSDDKLRLIVLSVIDSGPGIAATQARDNSMSQNDELSLLLQTLHRKPPVMTEPARGRGLAEVQDLMSALGGFIRIHSGSAAISRDFVSNPRKAWPNSASATTGNEPPQDDRADWHIDSSIGSSEAGGTITYRRGTNVSLVIPMYALKEKSGRG